MNRTVSRPELGDLHATHRDFFPVELADLEQALVRRPLSPRMLLGLATRARDLLARASWFAPQSRLMLDCARLHGQAAYGCALVAAAAPGEAVEIALDDMTVAVVRDEHPELGTVAEWVGAWCAALAARDQTTIAGMRAVPTELFRNARVQIDEYQYALAKAFLAVNDDRDLCLALVGQAREQWKERTVAMKSAADVDAALVSVIEALVGGNAASFNDALHRALTAHAKFWSKGDEYLAARGWVALRHVGLVCVAHDRGIAVEVESSYLPRALVERTGSSKPSLASSGESA